MTRSLPDEGLSGGDGEFQPIGVDVLGIGDGEAAFGGQDAVLEGDVADGAVFEPVNDAGGVGFAGDIDEFDVAEDGKDCCGGQDVHHTPFHLELECLGGIADLDVFEGHFLNHTASAGLGLEPNGGPVAGIHDAVADHHVADAARGLAAHSDSAVSVSEEAVFDEDVFAGAVYTDAVGVFTCLDGDTVVVDVDAAPGDQYAPAGVDVDAVGAGDVVGGRDLQVQDFHPLGVQYVQTPHGLVPEGDVADDHIGAVLEADEAGAAQIGGRSCGSGSCVGGA